MQQWNEVQQLVADDRFTGDGFGWSTALDGDSLIISADTDDDAGNSSGSAYLFTYDGLQWKQEAKLTASDADADDNFAYFVALSGDRAFIGAPDNQDAGEMTGSAYVFDLNCGTECIGDLDGDNDVDQSDLGILLSSYGNDAGGDIDGDGDTDQSDLGLLLSHYGETC